MKTTLFIALFISCNLLFFNLKGQERIFYLKGTSAPFSICSSHPDGTNETVIKTGISQGARCGFGAGKIYFSTGTSISRINLDGSGLTVIPNTSDFSGEIALNPAGDKIIYAGGSDNFQFFIIDTTGQNKTLFNDGQPGSIHQTGPSWNVAGTIFFVLSNYGNAYTQKIYSKPSGNPSATPSLLTSSFAHEPNSGGPGNLVIFNNLNGNLVTMNPDGSNQVILTSAGTGNYAKGTWHLSDSTFFYVKDHNIWKIKYNNTGNAQVTSSGVVERVIGIAHVPSSFTLTASVNPVCEGTAVTFTAHGTASFPAGTLQWYVNGVPVQSSNPVNGLVGWYPFTGSANDFSGYGNHGTVSGATLTNDRFGATNKAYLFDGVNDFIKINPSPSLDIKHGLTLAAWFKADAANLSGQTQITWRGDPQGGYDPYSLCFTNNGYFGFRRDVSPGNTMNQILSPATAVNLNVWHHLAGTYDSATGVMKLYLDGVLKTQQTLPGTATYPTSTFWNMIGGVDNGYGQNFKGILDDVRIYRRALSVNEIMSLAQNFDSTFTYIPHNGDTVYCVFTSAGSPGMTDTTNLIIMQVNPLPADIGESTGILPSLSSGLMLYYPFTGNASDQSGNGNHGTVTGATLSSDRFNHPNSAYFFDGINDLVLSANNITISGNSPKSMSVWINASSYKDDMATICGWGDASSTGALALLHLYKVNSRICFHGHQGYGQTNDFFSHPNSAPLNDWIHIGWKYDGVWAFLYINGIKTDSLDPTSSLITASNNFKVGFDPSPFNPLGGWNQYFHGKIDDIRVYNRALSDIEMWNLYFGGPVLSVLLSMDTICNGSATSVQIQNSQPSIQYQLLKNGLTFGGPQTGNSNTLTFPITGLTATSNFTIQAVNPATGCNRMLDTTLTVTVIPFVPTTSPDTTSCSGGNVTLQAFGGASYLWNNGSTSAQITVAPLSTTTYYVTVTNSQGCSGRDSVKVTVFPMAAPTISGSGNMCVNSGYYYYSTETGMNNYQWTVSPGATIIWGLGTKDLIVTWDQPGTQWVRVNYTNSSGCTALNPTQLNVTVNPIPGVAGAITGPTTVCAGATGINFSVPMIPNAVTYVWSLPPGASISGGSGTNSIAVDFSAGAQPGNITVYGNNLCGNGALSPALSVTLNPLPGIAGLPVGETMVCEGDTGVTYYVPPVMNATSYFWEILGGAVITSGNGTNSVHVKFPAGTGNCIITVAGLNACGQGVVSSPLAITVNPIPAKPVITQNGDMLVSSAPAGNQWFLNGAIIPNAIQQTFTPIVTGQYSVQVTLEGCPSERSDPFYYIMTGINAPSNLQATLWPNPNKGSFRVSLKGLPDEQVIIKVINSLGVKVHEQIFVSTSSEGDVKIEMGYATPGVYMVMVESGGVTRGVKMVVE
jgi:hypothetical protein